MLDFGLHLLYSRKSYAGVAKLAYAQDLKSCAPKGAYGFDPRLLHHKEITFQLSGFYCCAGDCPIVDSSRFSGHKSIEVVALLLQQQEGILSSSYRHEKPRSASTLGANEQIIIYSGMVFIIILDRIRQTLESDPISLIDRYHLYNDPVFVDLADLCQTNVYERLLIL